MLQLAKHFNLVNKLLEIKGLQEVAQRKEKAKAIKDTSYQGEALLLEANGWSHSEGVFGFETVFVGGKGSTLCFHIIPKVDTTKSIKSCTRIRHIRKMVGFASVDTDLLEFIT